ncbi:EamA family transporter RarD [Nakamurella deserti]|uniref:EamA family transporter RarD n=1 Tax=Nakamurella deserti TaxID=2164074 RepID=UPI000DBE4CC1|nr:EamA family transporter RarD [Nakamurella deserti]
MRRGIVFGLVAYGVWGLFPLFWPFLEPASAPEILAHRVVWSLVFMAVVLTVRRHWHALRSLPRRTWLQVAAASVLIAVNWGVYIFAVNNGLVVEAALGYYINPLVSVALAVLVLRERLRTLQWVAVGIAAAAVVVIATGTGGLPWIALTLASSFALYGLVKKVIPLAAAESLTAEALVLAPAALAFLTWLQFAGRSTLTDHGAGHVLLLAAGGLVTIVPLGAFAVAAQALPLSVVGFLQYLTPTMQFVLGVFWAHEHMSATRWVGFVIIWAALAVYSVDAVRHSRGGRREPAAATVAGRS